ncbi:SMI1/KNR4 family protein [Amycolatopsis speibonae]|uniref:SMI1/KNR4 family protein n=1 Tax=Amycolatopsis speibonae TaxID=1450224 RepID=A0ABV7PC38_9PSEU
MNCSVDATWRRITAWLCTHSPVTAATLQRPARAEDVRAVQHVVGQPLPDDLLAWWGLMNGVDDEFGYRTAFTVPGVYMPLGVTRVQEEWASLSARPDEDCCRPGGLHLRSAGEATIGFCTALIPVCRAVDGAVLAVDLRPGAEQGRVMDWMAEAGSCRTAWTCVGAMLADTAQRLEHHYAAPETPARPGDPTIRENGSLTWA